VLARDTRVILVIRTTGDQAGIHSKDLIEECLKSIVGQGSHEVAIAGLTIQQISVGQPVLLPNRERRYKP